MGGFDLSLCVLAFFVGVLPVVVNVRAKHIISDSSFFCFLCFHKKKNESNANEN